MSFAVQRLIFVHPGVFRWMSGLLVVGLCVFITDPVHASYGDYLFRSASGLDPSLRKDE